MRYFGLLSSHLRLVITFSIKNRLGGAAFGLPVWLFSFYDSFRLSLKSIFSSKLSSLTCFSICRWQTLSLIYKRFFFCFFHSTYIFNCLSWVWLACEWPPSGVRYNSLDGILSYQIIRLTFDNRARLVTDSWLPQSPNWNGIIFPSNERTNQWSNERTNKRTNEQTNRRTNQNQKGIFNFWNQTVDRQKWLATNCNLMAEEKKIKKYFWLKKQICIFSL